jgi:hypothetical protein
MRTLLAAVVTAIAIIPAASAFGAYGTQPGFGTATDNTACAGAGAFGAFGTFGDVGHDFSGGADGYQTGLNNSTLCGAR